MIQKQVSTIIEDFSGVIARYRPFSDLIGDDALLSLSEKLSALGRNVEEADRDNRLLRIGVIGQIKRGKSSFLNALLFDGRNVLPKAASPMTAALTRIRYGRKTMATIEFYSAAEWQQIQVTANKGFAKEGEREKCSQHIPKEGGFLAGKRIKQPTTKTAPRPTEEEKACMEVVEMANALDLNFDALLGKQRTLTDYHNLDELNRILTDYVGADGTHTPLVKSTELTVDLKVLKGIEIVDTPGINDPIISRSRTTQQFIGRCDVVFFLSNSCQFLDQADMRLLAQNIPSQGIRDIVLVGSLFDSAILDEGHKSASLEEAIEVIANKLKNEARNGVNRVKQQIALTPSQKYIAETLDKCLPPIFVSSLAFNVNKHWHALSDEESLIVERLRELFAKLDRQQIAGLANLDAANERLEDVRQRKNEILAERVKEIVSCFVPQFRQELTFLHKRITRDAAAFRSGDVEDLAKMIEAAQKRLDNGEKRIATVFEKHAIRIEKELTRLKTTIKFTARKAKRLKRKTGSETKQESYEVDRGHGFMFWRTLTGNRFETKCRTRVVNYNYVNTHDAIDQVEEFALEAEKELKETIEGAVHLESLRKDILKAASKTVDVGADDFDPDDVLLPVECAVSRITIPEIDLNSQPCLDKVTSEFSQAEVRDADIDQLRLLINQAVSEVLQTICQEIDRNSKNLSKSLTQTGKGFTKSLTADLDRQLGGLKEAKKDKQKTLGRYAKILACLEEDGVESGSAMP